MNSNKYKDRIIREFNNAVKYICKGSRAYENEVKEIIKDYLSEDDDFVVICWPEIQYLMDKEGFDTNTSLANDEWCLDKYGSSAYFVNVKWLNKIYE